MPEGPCAEAASVRRRAMHTVCLVREESLLNFIEFCHRINSSSSTSQSGVVNRSVALWTAGKPSDAERRPCKRRLSGSQKRPEMENYKSSFSNCSLRELLSLFSRFQAPARLNLCAHALPACGRPHLKKTDGTRRLKCALFKLKTL